jgi:signal transduction histidine kinase
MMDVLSSLIYLPSIFGMIAIATIVIMSSYSKSKGFFAAAVYVMSLWLFVQFITQTFSLHGLIGLRFIQFASALSFATATLLYCFIRSYIGKPLSNKSLVGLSLLFVIGFILNMSDLMIQEAWGEHIGIAVNRSTYLYLAYIGVVALIFLAGNYQLLKTSMRTKQKKEKASNWLLTLGFFQAVVVLVVANTIFASTVQLQAIIPISLLIMSIIIGLAIIKYQLFDIKLAVVRTVTYALSLLTLSVVYYGSAYVVSVIIFHGNVSSSVSVSPINITLAILLAFIFQPIKRFFDKITNKIFYKDNYSTDDFFAQLNNTLTQTTDLRSLLERVAHEIGTTLKGEQAFFFLYTNSEHYVSAGTEHHKHMPRDDALKLNEYYKEDSGVTVASLLEPNNPIRRLMISHRIELVLPLMRDEKIIGYLCLGDHLNSSYTKRDIRVLNTISDELVIAIQNALAVQEIREINASLKQRISNATKELRANNKVLRQLDKVKDDFISMASHQLRTPLTSVKGYLSMVIEGDAGRITGSQKKLLGQAFIGSENMVHLINDFLNVSRLQTGKFVIERTSVDLSELVQQEIDSLVPNAKARNMKLKYKKPKKFPMMDLDEGKIRQVVMNFADNAIYYSHEHSDIKVSLFVENKDTVVFTVKDSGIGVPEKEREQLFNKFYRASNARVKRPDGTGVGIYLAKKVVGALDGQIIFESVEGEGSTFGFRLPLK